MYIPLCLYEYVLVQVRPGGFPWYTGQHSRAIRARERFAGTRSRITYPYLLPVLVLVVREALLLVYRGTSVLFTTGLE